MCSTDRVPPRTPQFWGVRPRYMHQTTYRRYLRRFAKYQDQHQRRQLEDMARLLKLFK